MDREKIEKTIRNFQKHGFGALYFETAAQAADYLAGEIQNTSVGIGGSMTVKQMQLDKRLAENNDVYWHWLAAGRETTRMANASRVYITSANALSENGEIVNIDGTGNRLSAALYGPERVYVVCGINKLEPDLESAIRRARNVASPLNARRIGVNTPCVKGELKCHDCSSPERICRALLITERKPGGVGGMELVLIGESLGY